MARSLTGVALIESITAQQVPPCAVGIWWLGQSSLVLKLAGETVYIDPYLKDDARRLVPPAFPAHAVNHADLVLLTHDHGDHIDPESLPGIAQASPQARFVAPRPVRQRVDALVGDPGRVLAARAGEPMVLGPIEVIPVAAKHDEFDLDAEDDYPYLGYILRTDYLTIYNAGDTIMYDGLVETLRGFQIDLAILPINGRDFFRTQRGIIGNMDYREAAELATAIGADVLLPVHYGMFHGNTVPPGHLVSYLAEYHPEQQSHILGRYQLYIYQKP